MGDCDQIIMHDSTLFFAAEFDNNGVELWSMKDTTSYPPSSSVEATNLYGQFTIYPNPSDGVFTITLRSGAFNYGYVTVYDPVGRQIKSQQINPGSESIEISQLPKGVYLVKLQIDNGVTTKRVVVN
jgi:hypothetical protein